MGKLEELIRRLRAIDANSILDEAIMENRDDIVELNKEQLEMGLRSDGSSMPDYSRTSVNAFNKPAGPIQLYDTGDFYDGFFATDKGQSIAISSTDEKTGLLKRKYTSEIFGLTQTSITELSKNIKRDFVILLKLKLK